MNEAPLARAAARGVLWAFVAAALGRLVSLASLAILARLLAPADFGLLAFALVYITYVETIGDLGSGMALIYWPRRTDDAAQITFGVNLLLGSLWFGLTQLTAPAVAAFFNQPDGEAVLRVLACSFLFKALGNTHDALCQKSLRFRARLVPELGLALAKGVLSVALAVYGLGVWSLVWGQLLGVAIWTLLQWTVVPWRPRWSWPVDLLRPMLGYGRGIVAVNVLAALTHHADIVVVGRMLGTTALGFYQLAYKIPEMTITVMLWVASKVVFPAFSRLHASGQGLAGGYLSALRYSSLAALPAAAGLALLADPAVRVVFGDPWRPAAPLLQALAVYAGLRSLSTPAGDLLKAAGRSSLLAGLALARAALLIPVLVLAARSGGAPRVAWSLVGIMSLALLVNTHAARRSAGLGLRPLVDALRPCLPGLVVLVVTVAAWRQWTSLLPPTAQLVGGVLAGGSVYLLAVRLLSPEVFATARASLRSTSAVGEGRTEMGALDRFLVPVREDVAVRFFFERLFVPHRLRERIALKLAPLGGTRRLWQRRLHVDPGALLEGHGTWQQPLASLSEALDGGLGDDLAPPQHFILMRDPAGRERHRVVAFLFPHRDALPDAALKLFPVDDDGRPAEREARILRCLHRRLPEELRVTLPEVIDCRRGNHGQGLLLSVVPGCSAYVQMQGGFFPRAPVAAHFHAASRWLAAFHSATRGADVDLDAVRDTLPEAPPEDLAWLDELQGRGRGAPPLLASAGHGDFWARNVLMDNAGREPALSGVVDWEHAREVSVPAQDLFHFPVTYGLNTLWSRYRRRAPEEAFRLTFLEANGVSRAVRRYAFDYCTATGLDRGLLRPLLHLYLWTDFRSGGFAPGGDGGLWLRLHRMLRQADRCVFSG